MGETTWTVETLREYLLALIVANDVKYAGRFEESQNAVREAFLAQQTAMQTALTAQKLAVDTALQAADRAVAKAEAAADKRFDSVNEFRATFADQQRTYMPRGEVELLNKQLAEKNESLEKEIAALREAHSNQMGKTEGVTALGATMITIIGIALSSAIGIALHFIK